VPPLNLCRYDHTFRYNEGRLLKERQDKFCAAAEAGQWAGLEEFPEDLKWEALTDVIRGKVKVTLEYVTFMFTKAPSHPCWPNFQVHTHCYEAVDFDGLVRVSRTSVVHGHFAYGRPACSAKQRVQIPHRRVPPRP
jgi:hypothetical protein